MVHARADLEEFFHPAAVAVVGSVNRNAKPERLRAAYGAQWGERWYLVNAKGGAVGDIPIYEHVTDIPGQVTLAVVNVGTKHVAATVEECGRHGVPYVLIFSAGFSEVGPEGAALEKEVGEVARRYGIRVFGPNTNTNAFEVLPQPPRRRGGRIGLVTQSGHQGRPLVQGADFGVAFSRWVPTGNELDLEAADFIEYFAHDDDTAVIAGYFEGFKDPVKLRRCPPGGQRGGQAGGGVEDGLHRGRHPHGELAHRPSGRVRRRGGRAVPPVRGGAGARPGRAARDGRPVRQAARRHGTALLPLFDLGGVGHAHGGGGRVERGAPADAVGRPHVRNCAR